MMSSRALERIAKVAQEPMPTNTHPKTAIQPGQGKRHACIRTLAHRSAQPTPQPPPPPTHRASPAAPTTHRPSALPRRRPASRHPSPTASPQIDTVPRPTSQDRGDPSSSTPIPASSIPGSSLPGRERTGTGASLPGKSGTKLTRLGQAIRVFITGPE